jgi:hypothetical protein
MWARLIATFLCLSSVLSARCRSRVVIVTLEWLEPAFSGNGVYSRMISASLAERNNCLLVISGFPDVAEYQLPLQPALSPAVGALAASNSTCHHFRRNPDSHPVDCRQRGSHRVIAVPVPASTWRRLDMGSGWHSFVDHVSSDARVLAEVQRFSPNAFLLVDWHGALVGRALSQLWLSACRSDGHAPGSCKKHSTPPPSLFMSFRLFSTSFPIVPSSSVHAFFALAESLAVATSHTSVFLSRVDALFAHAILSRLSLLEDGAALSRTAAFPAWYSPVSTWTSFLSNLTTASHPPPESISTAIALALDRSLDWSVHPSLADIVATYSDSSVDPRWVVLFPAVRDDVVSLARLDVDKLLKQLPNAAANLSSLGIDVHDALPWVELFDEWALDESHRASVDDVDAFLASSSAARIAANDRKDPVGGKIAHVLATVKSDGSVDANVSTDASRSSEAMPSDALFNLGPMNRTRGHSFVRPLLLRFPVEVHPHHPESVAYREAQAKARDEAKKASGNSRPSDLDNPTNNESAGNVDVFATAIDAAQIGHAALVTSVYDNSPKSLLPLLPPRWLANEGYPFVDTLPDKLFLTVRSLRDAFLALGQKAPPADDFTGPGGDSIRHRALAAALDQTRRLQRPRSTMNLPVRRILLWCSRVSPEKAPMMFPRAVKLLSNIMTTHGIVPVMCVNGPDEALNNRVEKAMLDSNKHSMVISRFLGPSQLADLYARTMLYVHTPDYESYGVTAVEAATFGVPSLVHDVTCPTGQVCSSVTPGNASRTGPSETLGACASRLSRWRRGDVEMLTNLASRPELVTDKFPGRALPLRNESDHIRATASQLLSRVKSLKASWQPVIVPEEVNRSPLDLDQDDPPQAVGFADFLKPSLGLSYGSNMTSGVAGLAQSMARVLCRSFLRLSIHEAGHDAVNIMGRHDLLSRVPFSSGVSVPALSSWLPLDSGRPGSALEASDARMGTSPFAVERALECRRHIHKGLHTEKDVQDHIDQCNCLGFALESDAHSVPLGRAERIAARVSKRALSQQEDSMASPPPLSPAEPSPSDAETEAEVAEDQGEDSGTPSLIIEDGGSSASSQMALPHPGCVGLAARQAALRWSRADNGKALEALLRQM